MSWWIGLSREALWAEAQRHPFRRIRMSFTAESDRANWYAIARTTMARRREYGFDMSYFHDISYTEEPEVKSEWIDDPRVYQIEADRAYRSWRCLAYTKWPLPAVLASHTQACDYAATLMVMLRLGRKPSEWTDDKQREFTQWCDDNHEQLVPMLEMIE